MKNNVYAVIMAGGVGQRFWPLSKESNPKQFLSVFTNEPLILTTVKRISSYVPDQNIIIVTNKKYVTKTKKILKGRNKIKIIGEPVGKNTAPAIAAAAALIRKEDKNGVMAVLSADHIIRPIRKFISSLKLAEKIAVKKNMLVCVAVPPKMPHTGLGYIEKGELIEKSKSSEAFIVKRFVEKPDLKNAVKYYKSKKYFWNCGIFVWTAEDIINSLKEFMPDIYRLLVPCLKSITNKLFNEKIETFYKKCKSESIDYGVLEKSKNIAVVKSNIDWDDVGSWEAYHKLKKIDMSTNTVCGNFEQIDCNGCLVVSDKGLIAGLGLKDVYIVKNGDALLVADKNMMPNVKKLIQEIKKGKNADYTK